MSRSLMLAVSLALGTAFPASGYAEDGKAPPVWRPGALESAPVTEIVAQRRIGLFSTFMLDRAQLAQALEAPPAGARVASASIQRQIELPTPDGDVIRLNVWEDSFLSPELQAKMPGVRIYSGRGVDDPTVTAVIDITPSGFRAQVISTRGTLLIDPVERGGDTYLSFWKDDAERSGDFKCGVENGRDEGGGLLHMLKGLGGPDIMPFANPSGTQRTTYRLRVATTDEYTDFWGGRDNAEDAVVTTFNRVRGIYEREVAISFNLVSIDALLSSDSGYPFSGASINGTRLDENNNWLNTTYGLGSYDIGHVVSAAPGGGLAARPSVCRDNKGRGGTALPNPSGDVFDVDYVAHEVGHQIGGRHTFAGVGGNCNDANRATTATYEPGSGTTIMAYAGICGGANVQPNSNDYFHTHSFDEITTTRDTSGCGTVTDTGNLPPSVNAGADYTIPQGTPFRLTASGSDPDGAPVTFNWEQYDLGVAPYTTTPSPTRTDGPLFRSRPSTSTPTRVFPTFEDVLAGNDPTFERLPQVDREMNFRVTARDGSGGVRYDTMKVTVAGSEFRVQQPAQGSNQECGLETDLQWSVGGGNVAPNVRAMYSTDNGANFSTLLATTPNDGAEGVTLPKTLTTNTSRVMLEGIGNIFFSVSRPFSVRDTLAPTVTAPATVKAECSQKNPPGTPKGEVPLGTATSTDVCAGPLPVSNDAPDVFLLGNNTVTWSSTDPSGNTGTDTQTVTIEDTTKPTITVSLSPTELWPANHRMVSIAATVTVDDVCDPNPAIRLVSITSSEPDDGLGDGNFSPDVQGAAYGTADFEFQLRAERSGLGTGRTYTVTYEVEDASGNKSQAQATVFVPHDRR